MIASAFAVILIVSNIASSAKIIDTRLNIFGIRLIFDGGTLIFPLSYILGDILTEVYGFRASRKVIWTGFALSALTAFVFFALKSLPGEAGWQKSAGNAAYDAILGGMSSGGLVLASLAAFFAGEFSNSILLSRIKVIMRGRLFPVRAILSTFAGELLDSLLFVSVAVFAGVFPHEIFAGLVITNYALKCAVEILLMPLTCVMVKFVKHAEKTDVFDTGVIYNPFGF